MKKVGSGVALRKFLGNEMLHRAIWICSALFLTSVGALLYGMKAEREQLFPHSLMQTSADLYENFQVTGSPFEPALQMAEEGLEENGIPAIPSNEYAMPGINFVTGKLGDRLAIRVIDMQGEVLHEWPIYWSELWPNPYHLSKDELPSTDLHTNIHGAILPENGDVVFNFEHLGLVRLDICADVVSGANRF